MWAKLALILGLVFVSNALGDGIGERCFDFSKPDFTELKPPTKKTTSGKNSNGSLWGGAREVVNKNITDLYLKLLDHATIKDPTKVKLKVYDRPKLDYLNFHLLIVKTELPIGSLSWEEEWAYKLKKGTRDVPEEILIGYQKSSNNKWLSHLCGTVSLKSLSKEKTEVILYEELQAFGKRSEKDIVNGHLGTLKTLKN